MIRTNDDSDPVVVEAMRAKELGEPLYERLQEFPWIFMDLMFPLASEYLVSAANTLEALGSPGMANTYSSLGTYFGKLS